MKAVKSGHQPSDVVLQDTWGSVFPGVVQNDEDRQSTPPPHSVLSRLAEVMITGLEGGWDFPFDLQLGDDVVMQQVVESARDRVPACESAS